MSTKQRYNTIMSKNTTSLLNWWNNFQWWQDDDFVAQGKKSVLAFAEIIAAMTFYWLIASYFERPWALMLTICISPLLLLRSKTSIQKGLVLLEKYDTESKSTRTEKWIIGIIAYCVSTTLSYLITVWLSQSWLAGYSGLDLFWRSALIGALPIALTVAVSGAVTIIIAGVGAVEEAVGVAVAVEKARSSALNGATIGLASILAASLFFLTFWKIALASIAIGAAVAGAIATIVAIAAAVMGAASVSLTAVIAVAVSVAVTVTATALEIGTGAGAGAILGAIGGAMTLQLAGARAIVVILLPGFAIGLCISGWLIRFWATVRHIPEGISDFSHNWRETVLVSNLRHAPALIPSAGKVSADYNVGTLFKNSEKDKLIYIGKLIISIVFTFVAILYRWNIKASALIWAPIALGLSPTAWPHDPKYPDAKPVKPRTDSTTWTTKMAVAALFMFCLYLLFWLSLTGYEYLYDDIKQEIPNWIKIAHKYLAVPKIGFRFFTASVFLICMAWFSWVAYKMSADYYKALEDPTTYRNLTPQEFEGFLEAANAVSKWRKISQMMAVFTIYAFIFALAVHKFPHVTAFNYLHQFQNRL
jgi:hypothetical protein